MESLDQCRRLEVREKARNYEPKSVWPQGGLHNIASSSISAAMLDSSATCKPGRSEREPWELIWGDISLRGCFLILFIRDSSDTTNAKQWACNLCFSSVVYEIQSSLVCHIFQISTKYSTEEKNKHVICRPRSVRIGKNFAVGLEYPSILSIQDLGHSFFQYGPPGWWITYFYFFTWHVLKNVVWVIEGKIVYKTTRREMKIGPS